MTSLTSLTSLGANTSLTSLTSLGAATSLTSLTSLGGQSSLFGNVTAALMTARDGIVGPQGPITRPGEIAGGSDEALENWSSTVRKMVATAETLGGFAVYGTTTDDTKAQEPAASVFAVSTTPPSTPDEQPQVGHQRLCDIIRPTMDDFVAQMDLVLRYADLRGDRVAEIITQIDMPLAFFGVIARLDDERTKHTLHLLSVVNSVAASIVMEVKHAIAAIRPDAFSPQV
ncbi:MAG: hypothetical protein AAFW98_20875 [Pseudomonadota bacterium]